MSIPQVNKLRTAILTIVIMCCCFSAQAKVFAKEIPDSSLNLNTTALSQLYNAHSGYLWLKQRQFTPQTHDALEFIASSANHGFNPNDYHHDLLNYLDPEQSKTQAQQFDILLSDGLLKLMHDLAIGQLKSNDVDPHWLIPQAEFDAISFLQQSLITKQLKEQLNSLIPRFVEYQVLTSALARYQSYEDRGGWQEIPETPLLYPGDVHASVPLIRARLTAVNPSLSKEIKTRSRFYDPVLVAEVKQFQRSHSLKVDGIFGSETRLAMNVSAKQRIKQIKLNLDRMRWLPNDLGQRYIMVNIPDFSLTAIDKDQKQLKMRVIVGKRKRPTPSMMGQISHLVFHPYWNVPKKLARLDLLPKQQHNPNYFYLQDIRVYKSEHGEKVEVDPFFIDWDELSSHDFPYSLRQDPGETNALGKMKFFMPNSWDIYLHDTPNKGLFSDAHRNFSSGCIRLEDPVALAHFSLASNLQHFSIDEAVASGENQWLKLPQPVNVYTTYFTAWANEDGFIFAPDSYKRDLIDAKRL
jgi:murein L,D-transpeptidase YcbB/YkuD